MSRPTVSVLIPVYNAAAWLDICLESVLHQTVCPDEVILVDDGSTDGSAGICDRRAKEHACIRVLHQNNQGVAAARNAALDACTGELLMHVDADDWLSPECIARLLDAMQQTGAPIAACNHWIERGEKKDTRFDPRGCVRMLNAGEALHGVLYHGVPDVSCWAKLVKREVMRGLRYPVGRMFEDTYLAADLLLAAGQIAWTPEPLYHYRVQGTSITRGGWNERQLDYLDAVRHLTDTVRQADPGLEKGCIRREAHAAMSVRRLLVDCPDELKPIRDRLEKTALLHAADVLRDPETPLRDRIALLALKCGPWAYDILWKLSKR